MTPAEIRSRCSVLAEILDGRAGRAEDPYEAEWIDAIARDLREIADSPE